MTTVGAYIELKPGETPPDGYYDNIQEGYFRGKTPEGLDVYFIGEQEGEGPPSSAQVYLSWKPVVVAVWNDEEEEIENDNGDEVEAEPTGSDSAEESGEEPGQPGDFVGEEPAPSPEEPEPVE